MEPQDSRGNARAYRGTATATFAYDGDGNRVRATVGVTTTVYVGTYFEAGTAWAKYYYFAGQRVAMRTAAGVTYIHSDHLGSATNTTGVDVKTQRYYPWGARRSTTQVATPYRFTGQREESTIGLYFYNARWYDPVLGRFIQPDTLVPEPGNPQALNRYAYVTNNPVKYTDPTGHYILLEDAEEGFSEFSVTWRESNWYILSGGRWYRNDYERAFANYFLGHSDTLPPPASGAFAGRAMVGAATNAYRANEGIPSIGSDLDILSDPALVVAAAMGMMKAVGVAKDEVYEAAQRISGRQRPAKAYHYTPAENAERIAREGLRSKSSTIYTTPRGDLSPLQAQIDLALPPNRGLPDAVLR